MLTVIEIQVRGMLGIQRQKRFLKTQHRGFMGAVTPEQCVAVNLEFGTGGGPPKLGLFRCTPYLTFFFFLAHCRLLVNAW